MLAEPTTAPVAHLVKITDIRMASWNPANRISEKRLRDLRISVEDMEQMYYPLLIDKKNNLIDGHRRLAVAKSFGWKRVACITVDYPHDSAYGSVQLTQQRLTGNDIIGVYLDTPSALIGRQRARPMLVEKAMGRKRLFSIFKAGLSLTVYSQALKVQQILGIELEAIFDWIVAHKMTGVTIMLKGGLPEQMLLKHIRANKPLEL